MSFQFGYGKGGGIKYDPLGQQPGYSSSRGNSWGLGLGVYGQAGFNAGSISGNIGSNVGGNITACGITPYQNTLYPTGGLRGQTGISVSGSVGGPITMFGGGTAK